MKKMKLIPGVSLSKKTFFLIHELIDLARFNNINVEFKDTKDFVGAAVSQENTIILSHSLINCNDKSKIVSTFFHEVSHIIAFHQGKYIQYHRGYKNPTRKQRIAIRRTGWNAELYVDKKGRELMKEFYPGLKYDKAYSTAKDKREFQEDLNKMIPIQKKRKS
jgi:hypothetical protein